MFNKKTVRDVDVRDKIILLRADYNVPLEDGKIVDDLRIRASLPTLEYLLENGARKIIIISHLGRPDPDADNPELSLLPVAERLKQLLSDPEVNFIQQVSGPEVSAAVRDMSDGALLVLENLRFWPGEKKNDPEFAKNIVESTGAEFFVQDGFAVIHRAHASTDAVTKLLPSVAGLLLEKEVATLSNLSNNPEHPFAVIIGGAKVEDKAPLIEKFSGLADSILVGGRIAANGYATDNENIYVAEDFTDAEKQDLGVKSVREFVTRLAPAKTILWNGTLGKVEDEKYAHASRAIAEAIGGRHGITSVIAGGDTTAFVENLQKDHPKLRFTLISTGGGASLSLLVGEPLPGLDALETRTANLRSENPTKTPESPL